MPKEGTNKRALVKVTGAVRRQQALSLRLLGHPWYRVAQMCNPPYASAGAAYNAVMIEIEKSRMEGADSLREIEGKRLDALMMPLWPAALTGNIPAVEAILKIMGRRARLFGLDLALPPTTEIGRGGLVLIKIEGQEEKRRLEELADDELAAYVVELRRSAETQDSDIINVTPALVEGEVIDRGEGGL